MGRYLAAPCGTYASKVIDIKNNSDTNYIICDSGIHHLKYHGQTMAIVAELTLYQEGSALFLSRKMPEVYLYNKTTGLEKMRGFVEAADINRKE